MAEPPAAPDQRFLEDVSQAGTVFDLGEILLRRCRSGKGALIEHLNIPRLRSALLDATDVAAAELRRNEGSTWLTAPERRWAVDFIRTWRHFDIPWLVRVRALVIALDQARGRHFAAAAGTRASPPRRELKVGPDDAYPVPMPDVPRMLSKGAEKLVSPRFARADGGVVDSVHRLRLADDDFARYDVRMSFRGWRSLTALLGTADLRQSHRSVRLATCHPNRDLAEFSAVRPIDGGDQSHLFFDVRATLGSQLDLLSGLLDRAVDHEADIVVFPELAADRDPGEAGGQGTDIIERLGERFLELRRAGVRVPVVFIAGSRHRGQRPKERRNEGWMWLQGRSTPFQHWKFHPFLAPNPHFVPGGSGIHRHAKLQEAIAVPEAPRITVHMSSDFSVTTLICADFLRDGVPAFVTKLGVNLLLVMAMTNQTTDFDTRSAAIAAENQGWVALANNPRTWAGEEAPRAVLRRPNQPDGAEHPGESDPGLFVWDLGGGRAKWIPAVVQAES